MHKLKPKRSLRFLFAVFVLALASFVATQPTDARAEFADKHLVHTVFQQPHIDGRIGFSHHGECKTGHCSELEQAELSFGLSTETDLSAIEDGGDSVVNERQMQANFYDGLNRLQASTWMHKPLFIRDTAKDAKKPGEQAKVAETSDSEKLEEREKGSTTSPDRLRDGPSELSKGKEVDYTKLVNPFIGTGATSNPGNVFPGAAIPFGMAKFGIDVDEYAPAGYNDNINAPVRGLSLLHDTGTGSSSGSYGNFESMPVICTDDKAELCPVTLDDRKRKRAKGKDAATPGYFTTTLDNGIMMEATTTRRAGLLRFTWPKSSLDKQKAKTPFVVFDWTNDLPGTFRGGEMSLDPQKGRMTMNGSWASSFGSGIFTYQAYACYDLFAGGQQTIDWYGLFEGDRFGQNEKVPKATHATQTRGLYGNQPPQRGALISWSKTMHSGENPQILIRAGLSYISPQQACQNAEKEVPEYDFDAVRSRSKALWNKKLQRLHISPDTDKKIVELVYSSFYRQFLSPNNATLETQGAFFGTSAPYFDGLYCTWDTFRTFFPFLSLTSPQDYAEIVETYIDSWRKLGYLVECRANNVPGFTQGGSDGTNVLADFAVKYRNANLGVNLDDLYKSLYNDAVHEIPVWDSGGRQIGAYEKYGHIPYGVYDRKTIGNQNREGSRTLEYAVNDFGIRNVALLTNRKADAERWTKRALNYKNVFDKGTRSFGFNNFVQRRYTNGSFGSIDPTTCSPIDNNPNHACSLQQQNNWTIYETSSWEYSLFAPHDFAGLIKLLSDGDSQAFAKRVDTFFEKNLYYAGNEPSFQTPIVYHYANMPARSVDRVREIVYENFNTTNAGLPGNDDNGAMATLLLFHLVGLYPVPSTREFLIVSPFIPSYTLTNSVFGTVTVTAKNFDPSSLTQKIPSGARAYVKSVSINGKTQPSRCKIEFDDLFPAAAAKGKSAQAHTDIVFEMATKKEVSNCGPAATDLPSSMSTGGFDKF